MGLTSQVSVVFDFFRHFFSVLPLAVRLLVYGSFGGVVFIAVMKSIRR